MASDRAGLYTGSLCSPCMASGDTAPVSVVHDVWKGRSRAITSTQDSGREES